MGERVAYDSHTIALRLFFLVIFADAKMERFSAENARLLSVSQRISSDTRITL